MDACLDVKRVEWLIFIAGGCRRIFKLQNHIKNIEILVSTIVSVGTALFKAQRIVLDWNIFNAAQPSVGRVQVLGSKKFQDDSVSLFTQGLRTVFKYYVVGRGKWQEGEGPLGPRGPLWTGFQGTQDQGGPKSGSRLGVPKPGGLRPGVTRLRFEAKTKAWG